MPTRFARPAGPRRAFACCGWRMTTKWPRRPASTKKRPKAKRVPPDPSERLVGGGFGAGTREVVAGPRPHLHPGPIHLNLDFVVADRLRAHGAVAEHIFAVQLATDAINSRLDAAVAERGLVQSARSHGGDFQRAIADAGC